MPTKKSKKSTAAAKTAASEFKGKPLAGKAKAGKLWDPTETQLTSTPEPPELNAPRPSGTPLSDLQRGVPGAEGSGAESQAGETRGYAGQRFRQERRAGGFGSGSGGGRRGARTGHRADPIDELRRHLRQPVGFRRTARWRWDRVMCWCRSTLRSQFTIRPEGAALLQRTLTQWFAGLVPGFTIFDPKALYDQHAGRWVLLTAAFRNSPNKSVFLLSVSTTSNPLGPWRNYGSMQWWMERPRRITGRTSRS